MGEIQAVSDHLDDGNAVAQTHLREGLDGEWSHECWKWEGEKEIIMRIRMISSIVSREKKIEKKDYKTRLVDMKLNETAIIELHSIQRMIKNINVEGKHMITFLPDQTFHYLGPQNLLFDGSELHEIRRLADFWVLKL